MSYHIDLLNVPSYKIEVVVSPHWGKIIRKTFGGKIPPVDFFSDKSLHINRSESLIPEMAARFVNFYHSKCGIFQTWSDHHKTFVDEMLVEEYCFGRNFYYQGLDTFRKKYPGHDFALPMVISPYGIGFKDPERGNAIRYLSKFPYSDIEAFLLDVGMNNIPSTEMRAIKYFPKEIQDQLDACELTYNIELGNLRQVAMGYELSGKDYPYINKEWAKRNGVELYEDSLDSHVFESELCSLYIKIELHRK